MPMHPFHRTELLVGGPGYERLQGARVCVIGLGGVGSYAAEALARSGVGELVLVDFDRVCVTNVNRQLHATRRTVGEPKAALMAERARAINPKATVRGVSEFFCEANADELLGEGFDAVLDCIDNMTAKVALLERCTRGGQRVIAAMGAGGRLDPTRVRVSDVSETRIDPFARLVRDLLRKRGIGVDGPTGIECVWSDEPPNALDPEAEACFRCICPGQEQNTVHSCEGRHQVQGSVSWMPAIFGLTMAGVLVNRLIGRPVHDADRPSTRRVRPAPHKPGRARRQALLAEAGFARQPAPTEGK